MERSRRFVLWLLAAGLAATLLWKGHGEPRKGVSVAFSHYSAAVHVRLVGEVRAPGVYGFPDGIDVSAVIKMTACCPGRQVVNDRILHTRLRQGDIVTVHPMDGQHVEIQLGTMRAREKMLLGIPLHPDFMNADDWECLPGIGPKLAERITSDRQINGDFGSLAGVARVSGMGKGKIQKISRYF